MKAWTSQEQEIITFCQEPNVLVNHIRPAVQDTFRHSKNTHESIKRQKKECVREIEREKISCRSLKAS